MSTLVIGARGSVGRHVVEQLIAAGESVRASVRNLNSAGLNFPDGVGLVEADLTQPDTLKRAMLGIEKVFLFSSVEGAEKFIEAAREAELERIVLLSSGSILLPYAEGNAITEEHRAVEDLLDASGLPWTPIRPLVLANNALNWAKSIRDKGVVSLIYPEAVTAPIHERDIAAVAVAALLGKGSEAFSDMLTGSELLTHRQQVELIGRRLGKNIQIEELSEDQAREKFGQFEKLEIVEAIIELTRAANTGGSPATDTINRVLGRPALPFAQWVEDNISNFQ